jgi:hypothetical protein
MPVPYIPILWDCARADSSAGVGLFLRLLDSIILIFCKGAMALSSKVIF